MHFRRDDVVCLLLLQDSILSYPLTLENLLPKSNLNLIFRLNNHFKIILPKFTSKYHTKSDIFHLRKRWRIPKIDAGPDKKGFELENQEKRSYPDFKLNFDI